MEQDPSTRATPPRVLAVCRTYQSWQIYWFAIHYLAGTTTVIAGALATAAGAGAGPAFVRDNAWLWGLVASVLGGVVTFLDPLQKARSYKYAYYILATAMTRHEEGLIGMKALLSELERAQAIVLSGDPSAKISPTTS